MALIGVLATLTFTLGEGIRERGKIGQAKVELAVLATALEAYKSRYGDYPQTGGGLGPAGPDVSVALDYGNSESRFFYAIAGALVPDMTPIVDRDGSPGLGKVFVEGAKFTFENLDEDDQAVFPEDSGDSVPNAFLDPWGRRYQYFYKDPESLNTWEHPGFVLYSAGPDGKHTIPAGTGYPDYEDEEGYNVDNIYAGRN